jgi:molybdopterin molybdotransferase
VLTIGGVSVGDHDVVRDALAAEGVTLDFWRVAIKPGKPLCFGTAAGGTRVLGLPGNPSSALLTFVLFGAPLLRALQGDARPVPARTHGALVQELRRTPGRLEFLRVRTTIADGPLPEVHPLGNQQSGAFTSFAWCDALAELPADVGAFPAGAVLRLLRLADV